MHIADSFFFALLSDIYYTTITKFVMYKMKIIIFTKIYGLFNAIILPFIAI